MITPSFGLTATERVLPKLALDFTTAVLDPRITFTRALNTATRVNSSGYIQTINADLPRFDYNPITLACNGLLLEESRINLANYSDDFNNAYWPKTRSSISNNAVNGPDNTQTADKLIEDSSNNTHFIERGIATTNSNPYTFSVFCKASGRNHVYVRLLENGTYVRSVSATFNISNGSIVGTLQTNGGATGSYSIAQYANGFYRVSITATLGGVDTSMLVGVFLSNGSTISYQGDGSSGVYLWGAQLEPGAFPTSYIPTTTGTATRNADVATMTGTNFSSWYNQSEGTFVATSIPSEPGVAGVLKGIVTVIDETESNTIRLAYKGAGTFAYQSIVSGSTVVNDSPSPAWTTGTTYKMCGAYKLDNYASAVNGNTNTLDTSATVPTVDRCTLGALGSNIQPLNGHLRYLAYYPQRLINAEVQAFSK